MSNQSGVTCPSWFVKWPTTRLFVQILVRTDSKERIIFHLTGLLWVESTAVRWIPHTKGQKCRNQELLLTILLHKQNRQISPNVCKFILLSIPTTMDVFANMGYGCICPSTLLYVNVTVDIWQLSANSAHYESMLQWMCDVILQNVR